MLRDSPNSNGNRNDDGVVYHPMRSALVELEFITNIDGDALLISGNQATETNNRSWSADSVRENVAKELAKSITTDILAQP